MQLILTQKLVDVFTGEVLKDGKDDCTLGLVCCNGLLVATDKTQTKADKKIKRFELAMRLVNQDSADVTAEDIVLLKDRINTAYAQPLIVGQAFKMLDACGSVKKSDDGHYVEVD